MNSIDTEKLKKVATALIGREVRLSKRNIQSKQEEKIFIFKGFQEIGWETKIREVGTEFDPKSMSYHLSAELEDKKGKEIINIISLKEVICAIQTETVINYPKFSMKPG